MMSKINQELLERMVMLIRRCADSAMASGDLYTMREATEIVAKLPDLVKTQQVGVDEEMRLTLTAKKSVVDQWVKAFATELVSFGWDQQGAQRHAGGEYASDLNIPVGLAVGEFLFNISENSE